MIQSPKAGNMIRKPRQRVAYTEVIDGYGIKDTLASAKQLTAGLKSGAESLKSGLSKAKEKISGAAESVSSELKSGYHGVQNIREDANDYRASEDLLVSKIKELKEEIKKLQHWYKSNGMMMPEEGTGKLSKLLNDYSNKQAEKHGARIAQLQTEVKRLTMYRDMLQKGSHSFYQNFGEHEWNADEGNWYGLGPRKERYGIKSIEGKMHPISLKAVV